MAGDLGPRDPASRDCDMRVVWNVNAGSKAGIPTNRVDEDTLRKLMADHHLGSDLVACDSEEAAIAATRDAVKAGCRIVVAAGGDGTLDTIAFELIGTTTAVGILPLGSAMNVARSLGIPRELEPAAAILEAGHVREIDIGEAKGVPFLEVGSVGLNAAIFAEAQRIDRGEYTSIVGLIATIVRYRPARMTLRLDSGVIQTSALMVTVANGPYTGAGLTFAPEARLDDGRFDVRVFSGFSKWELLRYWWAIMFGRRSYSPKVQTYRSRRVTVDGASPRPCRVDARDLGMTPVTFVVRPRALRVVVPAPGSGETGSAVAARSA
jgi:diacylglycerol kinase (ATP)